MSTPENPHHSGDFYNFDATIWDPTNSEQAIEDPLHGPSARLQLSRIPDMPLGDGRYYRAGGFYASSTTHVDPKGNPIFKIGSFPGNTLGLHREIDMVEEWRRTYESSGEEGLANLEAVRQQARLAAKGVVFSFRPTDACGGGKQLDQCETARELKSEATGFVDKLSENPGEGELWTVLAWLGRTCVSCSLQCGLAIQTNDGKPTGITRFSNARPIPSNEVNEVSGGIYEVMPPKGQDESLSSIIRDLNDAIRRLYPSNNEDQDEANQ